MKHHQDLIRLENISLNLGGKTLLDNINMALHKGCITTLIGPNGAGKTSLVKVLLGLQQPSSGQITRNDQLKVGYMPQKLHLDQSLPLSVKRFLRCAGNNDQQVILEAVTEVGAAELLEQSIHSLSGGELQRVLLARALLRKPNLLVLDEPVQGVDIKGQIELYALIKQLRDRLNCGILMVSHDLHLVMSATDHVICLNQHICCSGNPDSIAKEPSFMQMFDKSASENLALYRHTKCNDDHHHKGASHD